MAGSTLATVSELVTGRPLWKLEIPRRIGFGAQSDGTAQTSATRGPQSSFLTQIANCFGFFTARIISPSSATTSRLLDRISNVGQGICFCQTSSMSSQ